MGISTKSNEAEISLSRVLELSNPARQSADVRVQASPKHCEVLTSRPADRPAHVLLGGQWDRAVWTPWHSAPLAGDEQLRSASLGGSLPVQVVLA